LAKNKIAPYAVREIKKKEWYNQYKLKYDENYIIYVADEMISYFQTNLDATLFEEFFADNPYIIDRRRAYELKDKYPVLKHAFEVSRSIIIKRLNKIGLENKHSNTQYIMFLQKNVAPDVFGDKQSIELSGSVKNTIELLSDEEREQRKKELLDKLNK
jgi:hypothetical protein